MSSSQRTLPRVKARARPTRSRAPTTTAPPLPLPLPPAPAPAPAATPGPIPAFTAPPLPLPPAPAPGSRRRPAPPLLFLVGKRQLGRMPGALRRLKRPGSEHRPLPPRRWFEPGTRGLPTPPRDSHGRHEQPTPRRAQARAVWSKLVRQTQRAVRQLGPCSQEVLCEWLAKLVSGGVLVYSLRAGLIVG